MVTIDGCSAGAGSTTNHMVNPRSWPFFQRAAAESGALSQWNVNSLPQAEALCVYGHHPRLAMRLAMTGGRGFQKLLYVTSFVRSRGSKENSF